MALALLTLLAHPVAAQGSAPQSAAAQPSLPASGGKQNPSPIVESIVGAPQPALEVRKAQTSPPAKPARRHLAHYHRHGRPLSLDRPALAGVLLVEPLDAPVKRQGPMVAMPAYFIDGIASAFTTPPPPIVCQHRRRDPDLPDPRLYREVPVVCAYDLD